MSVFTMWGEDDSPDIDQNEDAPPEGIDRHKQWGHAKIWRADEPLKWWWARRASGLGDPLEDMFAIHRWLLRLGGQAMVRNVDLFQLMQGVPLLTQDPRPDETRDEYEKRMTPFKREADAIMATALDRIGATRKANRGTALHRVWESRMRGEILPANLDGALHQGLDKMDDLLRGITIHEIERFVVWEDAESSKRDKLASAGTLDWTWSLAPGFRLWLPAVEGETPVPVRPHERRIGDTKSGDNEIQKVSYLVQPLPYSHGQPYDWSITEAMRREGDNGLRPWLDDVTPQRDYALILHVPLDPEHIESSALWWVDLEQAMVFGRMAANVRHAWSSTRRFAKTHFIATPQAEVEDEELAAQWEQLTVGGGPAMIKVEDAPPANIGDMIAHRIRHAETAAELMALRNQYALVGWTNDHAALADARYDALPPEARELTPTP